MICNNCGAQVADNAIFCPECGAAFKVDGGAVPQPAAPQPIELAKVELQPIEEQPVQPMNNQSFPQNQVFAQNPGFVQQQNVPQQSFQQQSFQQQNYQQQNYSQPGFQQNPQQTYTPESAAYAKGALVFGILGLSFACTFYLSFLGIIFSAIGLGKAGKFAAIEGSLFGKAKVGRGLSIGGLITSIILTVISAIVIIGCVAAISSYPYYF